MLVVKEEVLTSQLLGCKLEIHRRHPSCTHASSPWKPPASKTGKLCIWKKFHILCILERQIKHMKAKQKPLWFLLVHAKSKTRHQQVQRLWRPPPGFIANHSHAACSVVKGVLSQQFPSWGLCHVTKSPLTGLTVHTLLLAFTWELYRGLNIQFLAGRPCIEMYRKYVGSLYLLLGFQWA